jgi:hypothetical protein
MIVEERIYTLHHGKVPEYLKLYGEEGREIQLPILGLNVGYYQVDVGPQNTIVHLWAYTDYADREARRQVLQADKRWQAYLQKIRPLTLTQDTRILKPAPFFVAALQKQMDEQKANAAKAA